MTIPSSSLASSPAAGDSGKERLLLFVLAAIQFANIVDFVIMMPLGPQFMRVFNIGPQEFGLMVSAYTFSAAIFGLIGAFFIDRFDRKTALLTLYAGFTVGTLLCAFAPTHHFFIFARVVAGAFGGIMGAMVFAIIGDTIPESRRGAATGVVASAFSVASIAGVPLGLLLTDAFSWHAPFILLVAFSAVVWIAGYFILPSMTSHIRKGAEADAQREAVEAFQEVVSKPDHWRAFGLMIALMFAGFTVIPYLSPYMVANVGLAESDLKYIYLCGGAFTLISSRFIGSLADRYGKPRVFVILALLSLIPVFAITHLPPVPLAVALIVTTFFTVFVAGRFIPAMAMITGSVAPQHRGSFMSVNSSLQQLASGVASYISGLIIGKSVSGALTNYDIVGFVAIGATFICIALSLRLRPASQVSIAAPIPAEPA